MSRQIKYYLTDVFGKEKYSGNQLATFMNCDFLSDTEMQKIAREINFSETTFILSNKMINGGYDVRIFTPGAEVEFAGHPTLGTAYILHKWILKQRENTILLNLKVGQIPVNIENNLLWMKQIEPRFGKIIDREYMAKILSLNTDEIDERFPVQEVSTGLPFTIVPLKDMNALKNSKVDLELYADFIEKTDNKAILIFCSEGYEREQNISVRVFVDYLGIPEDPATGSGNGCLAGYIVKNAYFGRRDIDIITGQGYEIGRPSQLYLKAGGNEKITIRVGGKVIQIAEGYWE
ncbi:MAG: PhzF family phenazine biosynthesis protein [Bacteroidales bacterium]|jgi:trans-2,3-dihydro-3-hydroxyanthranilate isomerase